MFNKEQERMHELMDVREQIDEVFRADQEYINEMLAGAESINSENLESIRQHPRVFIREQIKANENKVKSRPHLSATLAVNRALGFFDAAKDCLKERDYDGFIWFYDYAIGVSSVVAPIIGGEFALRGDTEGRFVSYVEAVGDAYDYDVSSKAEAYVYGMKTFDAAKQLLIEDPSGFTLVDESVKQVCGEGSRLPSHESSLLVGTNMQIVRAGAVFGAKLYKEVYWALETYYS